MNHLFILAAAAFFCIQPGFAQTLGFDEKGRVLLDGNLVEDAQLEEKLRRKGQPDGIALSIQDKAGLPWHRLEQVMEAVRRSGREKFTFVPDAAAVPSPAPTAPESSSPSPSEETREIYFKIDSAGRLHQKGQPLAAEELTLILQQLTNLQKPCCVILLTASKVPGAKLAAFEERFARTGVKTVTTVYIDGEKYGE